jgi:putative membrane protein
MVSSVSSREAPLALSWFHIALQIKESVAIAILPRTLLFVLLSVVVVIAYERGYWVKPEIMGNLVGNVACNLVLGLLLVFRTNTAYDRYWEGRRAWGTLTIGIRNLAREIKVGIRETNEKDREAKKNILLMLIAFAIVTKQHLRDEHDPRELESLLSPQWISQLNQSGHRPLTLITWVGEYLYRQYPQPTVTEQMQLLFLGNLLNDLVAGLTTCERIRNTLVPPAYIIYLKRLLLIYCFCLPFFLVSSLHWSTPIVVGIIDFVLLGVEEIGTEIEDPFGHDPNDLPIDTICQTIQANVQSLVSYESLLDQVPSSTQ